MMKVARNKKLFLQGVLTLVWYTVYNEKASICLRPSRLQQVGAFPCYALIHYKKDQK